MADKPENYGVPEGYELVDKETLQKVLDNNDKMIEDLVNAYEFMEELAYLKEKFNSVQDAISLMTNAKKKEELQNVIGPKLEELANRLNKYEPYVRKRREQSGSGKPGIGDGNGESDNGNPGESQSIGE